MRFSAWSSLSISACSALALAGAASAGVRVSPQRVEPGAEVELVVSVSNDRDRGNLMQVSVGLPPDFRLASVQAQPGWDASTRQYNVTWEGGRIPPHQFGTFALRATAPDRRERGELVVLASFDTGATETSRVRVLIDAAAGPRDEDARTLGQGALGVAIAAALLALGGGALAVWLYLRSPPTF